MSQEPVNTEASLEEQLVAYLDGELDSDSCRRIEEMLAVDPEVRRKLHWLEQTWEMLDELESTPVDEDFTRTTLEMVAVAAEQDVRKNLEDAPRRRRRLWFFSALGLLIAGLAGFMAISLTSTNINRQLLQDLPVLENLDEYRQIKDIQFLRMLQKNNLFVKEEDATSSRPATTRTEENLIEHINSLSPSQKSELSRKHSSFDRIEPIEQNQLRQLHDQIQQDPQADVLRGIMQRYYEWYKSLPPYNRSDLNVLSAEERIKWIEERLQDEQSKITSKPPTGKDSDTLWNWMNDFAMKHENQLLSNLPDQVRHNLASMTPPARCQAVTWMIWQRPQRQQNNPYVPSEVDIDHLRSRLTPQTQKLLETKSQGEQIHIVQNWAHNLVRQRGPDAGELVDDQVLAEFFEKKLTDEQRDRLMNLPAEDMQRDLLRQYIIQNRPRDDGKR